MKVMCIKSGPWFGRHNRKPYNGPKYGEEVNVLDVIGELYVLKGYVQDDGAAFNQKFFIPLSNIDETEMVREHQTVTNF